MHNEQYSIGNYAEFKKNTKKRNLKQKKIERLNFKSSNYILFTSNTNLLTVSDENVCHRLYTPILEHTKLDYKVILFGEEKEQKYSKKNWMFFSKSEILETFSKERNNGLSKSLNENTLEVVDKLPSYINKASICWHAEFISWSEKIWHEILMGKLPKVIVISSYLSSFNLGLIRLAKKHNIKVIELAHGKQGLYNPVYSHWGRNASNNYNLLPDIFVTWRKDSQVIFEEKLGKESIYSCNPMLIRYIDKIFKRKYISIFLQGYSNKVIIPNHIINYISKNKDLKFVIKPHPSEGKPNYIDEILKFDHVTLIEGNQDTYKLLLESHFALTSYSSIIQDCVDLKIPCGVYGILGTKIYENEIHNNLVSDFTRFICEKEISRSFTYNNSDSSNQTIKSRFQETLSIINKLANT